jgi:hypothetical protein
MQVPVSGGPASARYVFITSRKPRGRAVGHLPRRVEFVDGLARWFLARLSGLSVAENDGRIDADCFVFSFHYDSGGLYWSVCDDSVDLDYSSTWLDSVRA